MIKIDLSTVLLIILAFGSFSIAGTVLSYLPDHMRSSNVIVPVSIFVGALSATISFVIREAVPPVITAFSVSLVMSAMLLLFIEFAIGRRYVER